MNVCQRRQLFLNLIHLVMKKDKLVGEDLVTLQSQRGNVCVTVILPTHRLFSERKVDKFEMEKAIEETVSLMEYKLPEKEARNLRKKLNELEATIDYDHNLDGIGLFVSNDTAIKTRFPFQVTKKIVVGPDFEIRDLLYKTNISQPYNVLKLSENRVSLYSGTIDELNEIHGGDFPDDFYDDREYSTPGRGSSTQGNPQMRSFEHDKSAIETIRFKDFFRHADELLGKYMVQDVPIILAGVEKDLAWYEEITSFRKHIAGRIQGNYEHTNHAEFARKCWAVMEAYLKEEVNRLISDFREKVGSGRGVSGVQEIWTSVSEGKGMKLVVEKDFKLMGFTTAENEQFLTLRPTKTEHVTMPDAIDEIIEMTLDKGGEVFFADNGQLSEFGGMILITRY